MKDRLPPTVEQLSDLSDQVTQLNSKLVRSFERISNLEDELHESKESNAKLLATNQILELESAQHQEALQGCVLVERAKVQSELQRLTQSVVLEAEKRSQSEASLSSINQELDDLSASLFSEANRLVAAEKLLRIKAERKVVEIEESMTRVEEMIEARRDQLNNLRLALEEAERERDEYKTQCELLRGASLSPVGLQDLRLTSTSSLESSSQSSSATPTLEVSEQSPSGASLDP